LARPGWTNLVISAEKFCTLDTDGFVRLRRLLEPRADSINAILYVRDPVKWAASGVQQDLRGGGRLAELLRTVGPPPMEPVTAALNAAFGADSVDVRLFDRAIRQPTGLIGDFCEAIGDASLRSVLDEVRVNQSAGLEEALILDRINKVRPIIVDGNVSRLRAPHVHKQIRGDTLSAIDLSGAILAATGDRMRIAYDWLYRTFPDAVHLCPFPPRTTHFDFSSNAAIDAALDAAAGVINDLALRVSHSKSEVHGCRARLCLQMEDFNGAEKHALRALRLNPDNEEAKRILRKLTQSMESPSQQKLPQP
jgi:hypothetical protein